MRPKIDKYFMQIAQVVASRSTCLRRQIGAVLVRDKQILTTGYNGPPVKTLHCYEKDGCLRENRSIKSGTQHELCRAVHAEQNAIIQAALHGVSTRGATMYCTCSPCRICASMIVNAGIVKFVTNEEYPDQNGVRTLIESGIKMEVI